MRARRGNKGGQSQLFTPSPPFMTFYRRSQALAGVLRRTVRRRQTLPAALSPLSLADALNIMRASIWDSRGGPEAAASRVRAAVHPRQAALSPVFGRSPSFSPPFAGARLRDTTPPCVRSGDADFLCSRLNNLQIGNTLRLPFAHDDAIIQQIRFNGLTGGPQFAYRHRYRLHHGQSRGVGRPGSYHFSYI